MTTPPVNLEFTEFWPKPVPTLQVQFTGFGDDGTGWDILSYLRDRGIDVFGHDNVIYRIEDGRAEVFAQLGWWLCIDPDKQHYFIRPSVHDAKYTDRRPS